MSSAAVVIGALRFNYPSIPAYVSYPARYVCPIFHMSPGCHIRLFVSSPRHQIPVCFIYIFYLLFSFFFFWWIYDFCIFIGWKELFLLVVVLVMVRVCHL